MKKFLIFVFIFTFFSSLVGIYHTTLASSILWQSKVDPAVLQNAIDEETEFILFLEEQTGAAQISQIGRAHV